jgi:hypothetical protein
MPCGCNFCGQYVKHEYMRNWMRERMRRRKKKQPENTSEATGKVGQQKPLVDEHHPEPLVPSYEQPETESEPESEPEPVAEEPAVTEIAPS